MADRTELEQLLAELDALIPQLITDHAEDDGEFWCAFAGHMEVIDDASGDEHIEFVTVEMHAMLDRHQRPVPRNPNEPDEALLP